MLSKNQIKQIYVLLTEASASHPFVLPKWYFTILDFECYTTLEVTWAENASAEIPVSGRFPYQRSNQLSYLHLHFSSKNDIAKVSNFYRISNLQK